MGLSGNHGKGSDVRDERESPVTMWQKSRKTVTSENLEGAHPPTQLLAQEEKVGKNVCSV